MRLDKLTDNGYGYCNTEHDKYPKVELINPEYDYKLDSILNSGKEETEKYPNGGFLEKYCLKNNSSND